MCHNLASVCCGTYYKGDKLKNVEKIKLLEEKIKVLEDRIEWLEQNHQPIVQPIYPYVVPGPTYNPVRWIDDQSTAKPWYAPGCQIIC